MAIAWTERWAGAHVARVGHLHLMVEANGEEDDTETTYNWFVCLDDDDKCDERAIAQGNSRTAYYAKQQVRQAVVTVINRMLEAVGAPSIRRGRR